METTKPPLEVTISNHLLTTLQVLLLVPTTLFVAALAVDWFTTSHIDPVLYALMTPTALFALTIDAIIGYALNQTKAAMVKAWVSIAIAKLFLIAVSGLMAAGIAKALIEHA